MKTGLTRVVAVDPRSHLQEIDMDIDILKSYKLTQNEWYTLTAVAAGHYAATGHKARSLDLDVLVLAGLVTRGDDNPVLTSEGHDAAAAIDMIFDWDDFAFNEIGLEV